MFEELKRVKDQIAKGQRTDAPLLTELLKGSEDGTLSDEELIDNLVGFMIAGSDTTSTTLSSILLLLSQHPKVQER